jgi:hypothetical protein
LVGVAVKVTLAPEHIVLSASFDAMLTLAATFGLTVSVFDAVVVPQFPPDVVSVKVTVPE